MIKVFGVADCTVWHYDGATTRSSWGKSRPDAPGGKTPIFSKGHTVGSCSPAAAALCSEATQGKTLCPSIAGRALVQVGSQVRSTFTRTRDGRPQGYQIRAPLRWEPVDAAAMSCIKPLGVKGDA